MSRSSEHHFPCPCGAELADECPSCAQSNPFGSMRVEPGVGSTAERGLRDVRAAWAVAPRSRRARDDDPNPTRARAINRARTERKGHP